MADDTARLRAALAGLLRWFGDWPVLVPAPEAQDKAEAAIAEARAALGQTPQEDGTAAG